MLGIAAPRPASVFPSVGRRAPFRSIHPAKSSRTPHLPAVSARRMRSPINCGRNPFRINTYKTVSKQMTLTSLESTLMKNMGGGGLMVNQTYDEARLSRRTIATDRRFQPCRKGSLFAPRSTATLGCALSPFAFRIEFLSANLCALCVSALSFLFLLLARHSFTLSVFREGHSPRAHPPTVAGRKLRHSHPSRLSIPVARLLPRNCVPAHEPP